MAIHKKSQATISAARDEQAEEIVSLWRQSFQRAMGLQEQNDAVEFAHQLAFYRTIPLEQISVAFLESSESVAGFVVRQDSVVAHLYVHVEQQGRGAGKKLMDHAKRACPAGLRLHTFQENIGAQRFYLSQGFVEVRRGVASRVDNPWASSPEQLSDIEYHWPKML